MNDKSARQEKLADIWKLTADGILRAVSVENPSASALNAARQFLNDNGVTLEVLRDWRRGTGFDPSTLPTFNDDDDGDDSGGSPAEADPLRSVPPFAPAEDTD
jgi:hypothetical protein